VVYANYLKHSPTTGEGVSNTVGTFQEKKRKKLQRKAICGKLIELAIVIVKAIILILKKL
jgi:hypothetical protein